MKIVNYNRKEVFMYIKIHFGNYILFKNNFDSKYPNNFFVKIIFLIYVFVIQIKNQVTLNSILTIINFTKVG